MLLAVLLVKAGLSQESVGEYEQLLYLGTLLTSFWVTGLMQALLARYPQLQEEQRSAWLGNAYLFFTVGGGSLLLLFWLSRRWWLPWLLGEPELPLLGLFLLYAWLNLSSFLLDHFLLLWRNTAVLLWGSMLSHAAQLPAMLLPVWYGYGLEGALLGLLAVGAGRQIWLVLLLSRHRAFRYDLSLLRGWLLLSLPLIAYALVGTVSVSFDSWLVSWYYSGDEERFAVFRYGAREFPLALALAAAFSSAMIPEVAGHLQAGLKTLRTKSLRLFHLLFPLSAGLMLSSNWWFPLLFSPDYLPSVPLFNTFMLITISRLVFSRTVLVALSANRAVFYFSLLELLLNVALGFALVGPYGLIGIAWATVLAYTLDKVLLAWYLYRRFGIAPSRYLHPGWFFFYCALLSGAYALSV